MTPLFRATEIIEEWIARGMHDGLGEGELLAATIANALQAEGLLVDRLPAATARDRVSSFIEEVIVVCRRHGLVISHRDDCAGFEVIDAQLETGIEWLRQATDATTSPGKVTEEKQTPPGEGA